MTQFTVSFGDFLCTQTTKPAILKAKKPVKKYRDVEVWEEEIIERPVLREVRVGCSPNCDALKAYTKSSFRRAIKEQDLTSDGRCVRCNMLARVGDARNHIQGFLDVEIVTQKHLVTKEEEYIDYEEVDVEAEEDYMSYVLLTPGWQNIYNKSCANSENILAQEELEPAPVVLSKNEEEKAVDAMETAFWTAYKEDFNRKALILKARQRVEAEREASIWKKLECELAVREANKPESRLFTNKYGTFYKPYTKRNKRSKWFKRLKRKENEMQLMQMETSVITCIENPLISSPEVPSEPYRVEPRKISTVRSTKVRKARKAQTKYSVNDLVRAIINIAQTKNNFQINILGNGKRRANKIRFEKGLRPRVQTKHHEGLIRRRDLILNPYCAEIEQVILGKISVRAVTHVSQIKIGDSGIVLDKSSLRGNFGRTPDDFLIVRGIYERKLFDARSKLTFTTCMRMTHCSDTANKFWKGFDESFRAMRLTQDPPHECVTNLDVEECGKVAAIVSQTIFPCWKITCEKCARKNENTDKNMFERLQLSSKIIRTNHPKFTHVTKFLEREFKSIQKINTNFEAFASTQRLIGHRRDGPFGILNELNTLLVRASQMDEREFARTSDLILELARWHNNRTESILKGDLKSFRNKATGKTQINMTLMCDNQRDKNGNFEWGERGRHAKRIFQGYFEIINPMDGYEKYIERFNINSVRKLAIGKLIISTDPHEIRESMKGEPVKSYGLDTHCVSKMNGNFVYQACCVTHEDGSPVESSIIMPTKNHLVIGNTGDAKYVDLPQADGINMYIAKKGYCYLNIFLAMLVNVNEAGAKNFTKMVRDIVIPKLKTWPTLIDLATMCYFMSVFHPETKNAELPRILVDHENCTMHVVDSYGSLNTGYHILKASTVNQLIAFASNSLESEMKLYQVGGLSKTFGGVQKTLFRSIYRPKEMRVLIQDEPYLLFMGMLSPSVLLALYTNKHLDSAINYWIQEDTNLALAISTLNQLAKKVSLAESLNSQFHIMHGVAPEMIQRLKYARVAGHSRDDIIESLKVISQRDVTNWSLHKLGFFTENNDLNDYMEKSYQIALKEAWSGLSAWEKLCSIYHSPPASMYVRSNYVQETLNASLNQCRVLPRKCFAESAKFCSKVACTGLKRVKEKCTQTASKIFQFSLNTILYFIPDIVKFVNVIFIIHLLLMITKNAQELTQTRKIEREKLITLERQNNILELEMLHKEMVFKMGQNPTEDEFLQEVETQAPKLLPLAKILIGRDEDEVEFQARRSSEAYLEKTVAFVALVLMIFDNEKSDCVYKVLNKVKSLVSVADSDVYHQSLDDIQEISIEKKLTIDFELAGTSQVQHLSTEKSFNQWWDNQLANNRVIPHYRIGGKFLEFTREKASEVAYTIAHESEAEFLIRGAVGSGKSTGLPSQLSLKGSVLLLEPTRPLTENVARQLRSEPFFLNPTVRMRGLSSFGSTPITVMTTGFAFSFYVVNIPLLKTIDFIVFDECHVLDGQAMAFYALLKEINYGGKILKVSATPPGRECEFTTQYPVTIKTEDSLSFQAFVGAQGTGSNADVVSHGDNILVYVASYNEVDTLSRMLIEKGHSVTKVDGRTMKVGSVEITTHGTSNKKHFVVATNIIENGVTLDIDVVVDFGTRVTAELDSDSRCISYTKHPICYGERIQRLGRVGRNKPGLALRIGHTEKGMVNIPSIVASQAALACFAHSLPVMTHNVSTSILGGCTVRQAQAMSNFELSPFFLLPFIKTDGSMHPEIHNLLKPYKLRESEMVLSERAIPESGSGQWTYARDYHRIGLAKGVHEDVKIFFYVKDVPDKLYEQLWDTIKKFKPQCQLQTITSASSVKIAHTLQTDIHAIHRTISHIDHLLEEERTKQAHFQAVSSRSCSGSSFSFLSISNAIRAHWMKDHSSENIEKLQRAKAQLLDFQSLSIDPSVPSNLKSFEALDCVYHQSANEISQKLQLKGKWNKSLITRDVIVILGVLIGGFAMILQKFKHDWNEDVYHQASGKNQRNRLKFRESRDKKFGNMVYGDAVERYFGDAYTNKPKKKGEKRGMGLKTKKFYTMYGYDPAEYNFIRFLDPLTGCTIDENPFIDFQLVADEFMEQRIKLRNEDKLENEQIVNNNTLQAYYVNNSAKKALKIDLTPHKPLMYCENKHTIAGYPEMEGIFRQTGQKMEIDIEDVPKPQGIDEVKFEGKSLHRGMRDYNGVAAAVCKLTNESEGEAMSLYGVGFGSLILTNQHLFKKNNGDLIIRSRHGLFRLKDTRNLECFPIKGKDLVVLRLPQDFPPFPTKLKFRKPISDESICIIGNSFQEKSNSTLVSESGKTYPKDHGDFWKHWISTKDGQCGSPIVSTTDGFIVGLHSLSNLNNTINYFAGLEDDFAEKYLDLQVHREWRRGWAYNPNNISWGNLNIHESKPDGLFKITKTVTDLIQDDVYPQGEKRKWMYESLEGNLQAIAETSAQLVTKHPYKGKCMLFQTYLELHPRAKEYFENKMGFYQKSVLSKEAYIKDVMKYSNEIIVGVVDCTKFEQAIENVIWILDTHQFGTRDYITCGETIYNSLNMKAAVGALYGGKKREFFDGYTPDMIEEIVKQSCKRLYMGKIGIWNGSLKGELRPKEKVEAGKTRSFTAAPIDTLLGGKVCVDDFNNRFYDLNLKCPWSVGMTKFYGGWNTLMEYFPEGWIYCDADGSQFDSSLSPYLINAVLRIRLNFMEEWDVGEQMLRNLYTEIIYTPILTPDGTIIKKFKGNNSGQPSTVVDNSLMVMLAMQYSLLQVGIQWEHQNDVCRYMINGDDLLVAVEPKHEFILDSLQQHFLNLGLKYEFDSRTKDKSDLWFMSHKAIKVNDKWIPKLEEERIVSILEWDRSEIPEHRVEAICASMIEAWGYPELIAEIRRFYLWVLDQQPYAELARRGRIPYITDAALRKLYTNEGVKQYDIEKYLAAYNMDEDDGDDDELDVYHQAETKTIDAGATNEDDGSKDKNSAESKEKEKEKEKEVSLGSGGIKSGETSNDKQVTRTPDKDINAGSTSGTWKLPRIKEINDKMVLPRVKGKIIVNLDHLLQYAPSQSDISNKKATHDQLAQWYNAVGAAFKIQDKPDQMGLILNGFMIWCIENGTSHNNTDGNWVMMEGSEQVAYPLAPMIENAKPSLRQIMTHFSNLAEAYITRRNQIEPYMPRYGLIRNLNDMSLARYAFDFYEVTSKTPRIAREAHFQMKAAALRGKTTRLFGLDGNVGSSEENTERHTTDDVNRNMHTLLGMAPRSM